jgi:hypothetical protein
MRRLQLPAGGRTFRRAQVDGSFPLVLSALAATPTESLNAQPPCCGTILSLPLPYDRTRSSPCEMVDLSAETGSALLAVPVHVTTAATSAQGVHPPLTELRTALELRKLAALTPYDPRAWEILLTESRLIEKYPLIPESLRTGFLINMPNISVTQTPPNNPAIYEHQSHFDKIINLELFKHRYIGPFSRHSLESLIGPFQSSPFSIIPKPGRPGLYRLIQNYSFPHDITPLHPNPSINSSLNSDDFPTTWGTFSIISLLIHQLPPYSQLATRDVAEAYRTIPLHYSQWPGTIVRIGEDDYCADTTAAFGFSPSAGVYGNVADAGADLFRHHGIGPLAKWVDDHLFFRIRREFLVSYNQQRQVRHAELVSLGQRREGGRLWYGGKVFLDGTLDEHVEDCAYPCLDFSSFSPRSAEDALYSYNFDDIDRFSANLGIPWERSKDLPFAFSTCYIGFLWDLESLTVSVTLAKRQKYSLSIEEWFRRPKHNLNEVQKIYGKLMHACLVLPAGRAYLTGLEAMLTICASHPFVLYLPVKGISEDLAWWAFKLSAVISRPIPSPLPVSDIDAFSDASSGFGVAIVIGDRWRAWRLIPGWQSLDGLRDIGWAEALGFELLIRTIPRVKGPSGCFRVFGDNKGVVEGWRNFRSRNKPTNLVFRRIHSFLEQFDHSLSILSDYVPSASNPADPPSRGIYPPAELLLPEISLPPGLDRFIVDSTHPYSPTEVRLFREGRYPPALALGIEHFLRDHGSSLRTFAPRNQFN